MRELSPAARARYFRRQTIDRVMGGLCVLAAGIGLILLGLILWMLFSNGIGGLSLSVFTNPMAQPGAAGGLANAIVGSLIQVGLGAMIGAPIGMMVGVYLSEVGKESRFASVVRFVWNIAISCVISPRCARLFPKAAPAFSTRVQPPAFPVPSPNHAQVSREATCRAPRMCRSRACSSQTSA